MEQLIPAVKDYDWGSPTAIPEFTRAAAPGGPVAEYWYGIHPEGLTRLPDGTTLAGAVEADPDSTLGADVVYAFGPTLPYMMKLVAPASPLSLQVHPTSGQAREGFEIENTLGIPLDAPERTYRDRNHKPEMIYALTDFEALCGFRVPRRVHELLDGLEGKMAFRLTWRLRRLTAARGIRSVVSSLFDPDHPLDPEEIAEFADQCASRLARGESPSERIDRMVVDLQQRFPGDPGVVVAFLMNPVSLKPGEALFIPAGVVHSYRSGLGVEVLSSSDNVVRAGLTHKHVDAERLIDIADFDPVPPVRIAPERPRPATERFYAPVQDFELSVTTVDGSDVSVLGTGPRVLMCIEGEVTVRDAGSPVRLGRGDAVFARSADGAVLASGHGRVVQTSVP